MNDQSNNAKGMLRTKDHILSIDPVEGISSLLAGITTDTDRFR